MKNIYTSLSIALVGIIGLHAVASAQFVPADAIAINPNKINHLKTVVTSAQNTVTPSQTTITPVVHTSSNTVITASALVPSETVISAIDTTASGTIGQHDHTILVSSNPVVVHNAYIDTFQHAAIIEQTANLQATGSNQSNQNVQNPNTGNTAVSTGSYGNGHGSQPVVYHPVVTQDAPRPAVYTETVARPKTLTTKQVIPLLEEDVVDTTVQDKDTATNSFGASIYGISGSMSLIGILLIIAVLLAIMVAVKEYRIRNQVKQGVHYA